MKNKAKIIKILFTSIDEINNILPNEQQLEKSNDTVLFGDSGKLDSIGLINLIVAIEERIQDEFDMFITLADERAMSQKSSPFKTIGSLVDYIVILLGEKTNE